HRSAQTVNMAGPSPATKPATTAVKPASSLKKHPGALYPHSGPRSTPTHPQPPCVGCCRHMQSLNL
ncbi:hypothetical protein NDU88_005543, partial [Pleurodeles waltl]